MLRHKETLNIHDADVIFDTFEELHEFNPGKWPINSDHAYVCVQFHSSTKVYRYFTINKSLAKNDILEITALGKLARVRVIGYANTQGLASKHIDINRQIQRRRPSGSSWKSQEEKYRDHSHMYAGTRPTHIILDDIEETHNAGTFTIKGVLPNMKITTSAKKTIKKSAKLGYTIQKGNAGLSAVHATFNAAKPVPESVKVVVAEYKDYINLVLGLGAETLANAFADSTIIRDFAESVNTAATAKLAIDITTIQSMIENVITNVLTPVAEPEE